MGAREGEGEEKGKRGKDGEEEGMGNGRRSYLLFETLLMSITGKIYAVTHFNRHVFTHESESAHSV